MRAGQQKRNQYTSKNNVKILRGGAEFFACLEELIDSASYSFMLQTYIFDPDETGTPIINAMKRAAARNVLVYVLIDGYASQHFSAQDVQGLKNAGVSFGFFEPVLKSKSF